MIRPAATSIPAVGCPSSRSRAAIPSAFRNSVVAGASKALDVVFPAPFGPAPRVVDQFESKLTHYRPSAGNALAAAHIHRNCAA